MKETKKHYVNFRLTDAEWQKLEEAATASGEENPNEWSRKQILEQLAEGDNLTRNERLLFEEVACLRFMFGHAFVLLATQNLTEKNWKGVIAEAIRDRKKIADHFKVQGSTGR